MYTRLWQCSPVPRAGRGVEDNIPTGEGRQMELTKPALVHYPACANWYGEGLMLTHMNFGIPA